MLRSRSFTAIALKGQERPRYLSACQRPCLTTILDLPFPQTGPWTHCRSISVYRHQGRSWKGICTIRNDGLVSLKSHDRVYGSGSCRRYETLVRKGLGQANTLPYDDFADLLFQIAFIKHARRPQSMPSSFGTLGIVSTRHQRPWASWPRQNRH
jgi:hypothetical protein